MNSVSKLMGLLTLICSFAAVDLSQTNIPEDILSPRFVDSDNLIHLGDVIDVDFVGSTEFDWRGSLSPEGILDQIGFSNYRVNALCRSETDVANDIAALFSKTLRDPKVVVKILDRSNRSFAYIIGAVKSPQRLRIKRTVHLNELIVLAGGLTEKARGEVQILRPTKSSCEANVLSETEILNFRIADILKGDPKNNPTIRLGDIVTVKETQPIYVIGGVRNPRQVLFRDNITLMRAIDSAGGFDQGGNPKQIAIYRRNGKSMITILVDYEQIIDKRFQDIELQKYDIIEVGSSGGGSLTRGILQGFVEKTTENAALPLRIID